MSKNSIIDCSLPQFQDLLFVLFACGCIAFSSSAQETPDWMFALEGRYVGRFEQSTGSDEDLMTQDARFDGLRNGDENGFVLQVATESQGSIVKTVQMWSWNEESETVAVAELKNNQAIASEWFVSTAGLSTTLTRGASEGGAAVIERWRLERLPGQLRWDKYVNFGDGKWQFRWRYVLDEVED